MSLNSMEENIQEEYKKVFLNGTMDIELAYEYWDIFMEDAYSLFDYIEVKKDKVNMITKYLMASVDDLKKADARILVKHWIEIKEK